MCNVYVLLVILLKKSPTQKIAYLKTAKYYKQQVVHGTPIFQQYAQSA